MKFKELKEKATPELEKLLREQREHLRATRFAISASQEHHVRKVRSARKTIARILTLLTKGTGKEAGV